MFRELAPIVNLEAYRRKHNKEEQFSTYGHLLAELPPGSIELDLLGLRPRIRNLLFKSGITEIDQALSLLGAEKGPKGLGRIYRKELEQKTGHFVLNYP